MSIINRYLQREILLPFFYALMVLVFILLLGQLFKIVNMVVSEGVRVWDVVRLVLALIPKILTMALPISFFFAVLVGLGRMVGDGEVVALKAAGVSPYALFKPVFQLALACTFVTMLVSAWLAPWGMRQVRLITFEILQEKVTLALRSQSLNLAFPGMAIYMGKINRENGRVAEVFIEDRRHRDQPQTITALEGVIVGDRSSSSLLLQLENGTIHEYDPSEESYRVTDFSQYRINFDISDLLGEEGEVKLKNKALSNTDLWHKIALRKREGGDSRRAQATLYERFTQPFSCLAFALLGLALALVPVRSGARFQGFIFGLIFILAYYLTGMVAEYLAEWLPSLALFFFCLPNLIFLSLGAFLLHLKQREVEFSFGAWNKIVGLVKKSCSSIRPSLN
ncbi:MAG: LPS export ABC transporter permease LptF [Pseudomonadota bacterium]|nr:LPS export ABC transporter permease LptF [Pseudomonadota bacterium]